jgi:hypothetical protein
LLNMRERRKQSFLAQVTELRDKIQDFGLCC